MDHHLWSRGSGLALALGDRRGWLGFSVSTLRKLSSSKSPDNLIINPPWFACLIHSFSPFLMNVVDSDPEAGRSGEKRLTSFPSASRESHPLCSHSGKQVAFYVVSNLMLEMTILLPSLKYCVLSWREFPWFVLSQWWVKNGMTSKGGV